MLKYEIDQAHTHLGFTAKHLAVSTVRGRFNKFEGEFESPDDDYTKARGEVKVEVASLESRSDQRDTTFAARTSSTPRSTPTSRSRSTASSPSTRRTSASTAS